MAGNAGHYPGDIPRFVSYTSPVSIPATNGRSSKAATLPLNLILMIVSYLDDIGDIARVTRTSRLLYYVTLPQLYKTVNLHSYPEIRYINGRPEGFGSGSPFVMALNGLVTKPHAQMVQDFRIWGQWNEQQAEDFAKGRVPDNSMMLNILLRAAVDRMTKLQSFSWELDCKPLKTLYQGLGVHSTLTSLTIKFPKSRLPRPSVIIPPMASLKAFRALDIDPLCYPDDFSVLLLHSKKLEDLRIHFSPRMRQEAESSLNLNTYFGRCFSAGYKLPIKHFGMQNYYGPSTQSIAHIVDHERCRSICFIDMFGGVAGSVTTKFYDDTWKDIPPEMKTYFRNTRCNEPAEQHVKMLAKAKGHERFYMVNAKSVKTGSVSDDPYRRPVTPANTPPDDEVRNLGKQYFYVLTQHHGSTLKHLLLSDQWILSEEDISDLVRLCPNLEQLGMAAFSADLCSFRLLLPFLPKLYALRILGNETSDQMLETLNFHGRHQEMGQYLEKTSTTNFRYMGVGDRIFEAGARFQDEKGTWKRDLHDLTLEDVKHIEIWRLDNLDIGLDPVATFTP